MYQTSVFYMFCFLFHFLSNLFATSVNRVTRGSWCEHYAVIMTNQFQLLTTTVSASRGMANSAILFF